ncbi:3-hydroxyacyl-ACP dehydratase [Taibaiella soli]|nr:3-hydroxyacyl-ACP dehydratase [Taibaiella soli]
MNDFYTVHDLKQEENTVTGKILFNQQHEIFKGHFPGQPVVPGVCTMQIVKEIVAQQTGTTLTIRNTGQVKFLQLILPEVAPVFTISWKIAGNELSVDASFKNDQTAIFKMTAQMEAAKQQFG